MTFGKLDEKATSLIITPTIFCSTYKGGVSIDENGVETEIKIEPKEDRDIVLEDIVVDLSDIK